MTASVAEWLDDIRRILAEQPPGPVDDVGRRLVVDRLGRSGEAHRHRLRSGGATSKVDVAIADIRVLCTSALGHLDSTITAGRRADGLYHSYNRVSFPSDDSAHVDHLDAMLEGQVAVISSGALTSDETLDVIDALYTSDMYRADQDTFLLYPPVALRSFLYRNAIVGDAADRIRRLADRHSGLDAIVATDVQGGLHFRPAVVNARALDRLLDDSDLAADERATVAGIYEDVFDHESFTGRSGRMHGYEGIGSIYWHMVAKLLLAAQEAYWVAVDQGEPDTTLVRLADAYRRIRAGLGYRKFPTEYGAVPTDCYSHTPAHAGARQPGMTGQVKEEVLARFGELGLHVTDGRLRLGPGLIEPHEVLRSQADDGSTPAELTVCGVPMSIETGADDLVIVECADGSIERIDGLDLTSRRSSDVFTRTGTVSQVRWIVGAGTMTRWRLLATTPTT